MNSLLEIAKARFSVRSYTDKQVEREKLDYILECAHIAPSAVNRQPWNFIVLQSAAILESIYGCYERDWLKTAPVVIVCCSNHSESWHRRRDGKDHADIDLAIATEHICLAAAEQGLGTCWICNFDSVKCAEILALPEKIEPVALIPVGYPSADATQVTTRKPIESIVEFR